MVYSVFVIAEKKIIGACLEAVLRQQGYLVTLVETYGRFAGDVQPHSRSKIDLVIVTNTSIRPDHIQAIIPEIKAEHPDARIVVLSGYSPEEFVADLKQKGVDGFLALPFEEDSLLDEVAGLLSQPTP